MADEILLESGTNEVEILEFFLGDQSFGINVAKISQITPFDKKNLTVLPDEEPAIMGSLLWHGQTIPLIDLSMALHNNKYDFKQTRPIVLVTEFNTVTNAFLTDGVSRIFRVSWDKISPLSSFMEKYSSTVTGSIHIDDREILLVDFEFIIAELFPETKMGYHDIHLKEEKGSREEMNIVFAEDSPFIRTTILDLLNKSGYKKVSVHENGQEALEHIKSLQSKAESSGDNITEYLNLVISDIEMPKMDGLTLCKNIKHGMGITNVPVIIFSSLVNPQMIQKCNEVGADDYTTKPQINKLLQMLDQHLGLI